MASLTQPEEQRVARLQKYVDQAEQAMAKMITSINNGEMEGFSEEEIRFYLSNTPNMIASCGLFLAKMERAYEYAKIDSKIISAEVWKKCNQHKDDLGLANAKDREAYVQTQPEYIKAQQTEIEWKYRVKQMQVVYDRYENLFTSSRKLANLVEKDQTNMYRREKYE